MKVNRALSIYTILVLCLVILGGCHHRIPRTDPNPGEVELTEYELVRNDLRTQIEHARSRGDKPAELLALIKYNNSYDYNESMVIREMDLHLELNAPEQVVLICDRLLLEQINHKTMMRLGRALEMQGEYAAASSAYEHSLTEEPDPETLDRLLHVRMLSMGKEMSDMISDYGSAPWITRDELAIILLDRFEHYFPINTRAPIVMDIDLSTNQEVFLKVISAGLIEVSRDHRARPTGRVRKFDLVTAMYLIMQYAGKLPSQDMLDLYTPPMDLTRHHRAYKYAVPCLAVGLVSAEEGGRFQAGKIMSGSEIIASFEALSNYLMSH